MSRATVDLPLPDSPTRASVSPALTSRSTPSTARSMRRGSPSRTRSSSGRETSKSRLTARRLRSGMQPAGRGARAHGDRVGTLGEAAREALRAARVEGTTRRDRVEAWHGAIDLDESFPFNCPFWNGAHQAGRIGGDLRLDDLAHRADLAEAAGEHPADALRRFAPHAHVLGAQHHRHSVLAPQALQ